MLSFNRCIIAYILFCPIILVGQNLIVNGDFETYDKCPTEEGNWEGYATGWTTFFGTPNYLNCAYYGNNPVITPTPHSGTGLASCVWFDSDYANPPNVAREYLVGGLSEELSNEEEYYLFFWIYVNEGSPTIRNQHIGIVETGEYEIVDEFSVAADITFENNTYFSKNEWHKMGTCFTANGGEDQIIMGNFFTNAQTEYIDTSIGFTNFNFIDDVGLYSLESLIPSDTIILVGQYYDLDTTVYQQYRLEGEEIEGGRYYFNQTGIFEIEVFLAECGLIGSFEVEVIDCDEYVENRNLTYLEDATYCIGEGIKVELPQYEGIVYYHNMEAVDHSIVIDSPKEEYIYMFDDYCGLLDSIIYRGLDCNTVTDSLCFYVPNVFSPNNDGVNDYFQIQGRCEINSYSLQIFDRWGDYVFKSDDVLNSWNGQYKGKISGQGVYIYVLEIEFSSSNMRYRQFETGTVTLIR